MQGASLKLAAASWQRHQGRPPAPAVGNENHLYVAVLGKTGQRAATAQRFIFIRVRRKDHYLLRLCQIQRG